MSDLTKMFLEIAKEHMELPYSCEKAKAMIDSIEDETYAISGDLHTNGLCDEINFFTSKDVFEKCRNKTMRDQDITWTFDSDHQLACMKIDHYKVPDGIEIHDFYITKDMEGYDEVVKRLYTIAQVALL